MKSALLIVGMAAVLVGLRSGPAVVAAGAPVYPHRRAVGGDAAVVRLRLGEREE